MDVLVIEAVPAGAFGVFAVAFQVEFAIVDRCIVLAGDEEDLLRLRGLQHLVERVVFAGFGRVAEIAGVNDEVGLLRERVDLGDGGFESGGDIGVGGLVEAHVGVADLDEMEFAACGFHLFWPKAWEVRTPPAAVQMTPVPAQAMHSRKPRRSMPSLLWS